MAAELLNLCDRLVVRGRVVGAEVASRWLLDSPKYLKTTTEGCSVPTVGAVFLWCLRGIARLGVTVASLLLAFAGLDLVGTNSSAVSILAATIAAPTVFGLIKFVRVAVENGRLGWLLGSNVGVAAWLKWVGWVAIGWLALFFLAHLFAYDAVEWLNDRGGASGVLLTVTVVSLGVLAVSALARLVLLAALPISQLQSSLRTENLQAWDSVEASAMLMVPTLCIFAVAAALASSSVQATYVDQFGPIHPGTPTVSLSAASDADLLTGLAPVLAQDRDEGRPPQRVDEYLSESRVVSRSDGTTVLTHPSVDQLPSSCERPPSPCFVVENDSCPDSPSCTPLQVDEDVNSGNAFQDPDVVGYGRVLRRASSPTVGWEDNPFGSELTALVQYWLFVPLDDWSAPLFVGLGKMEKRHAGDWESVTIGLSDSRPLFVAASSHCGGSWRPFNSVLVENDSFESADPLGHRLHALLAYTKGSHGMYFDPLDGRAPDAFSCEFKRATGFVRVLSYVANVKDTTTDDLRLLVTPIVGSEAQKVLTFPAYWGLKETIATSTPFGRLGGETGTLDKPGGPSSPSSKGLYRDPIQTIFCSSTWRRDGSGALGRPRCA